MFANPTTFFGAQSIISSVQQITISVNAASTSNTATIIAVDTSRTFLIYGGISTGTPADPNPDKENILRIELTNSTTLTAYVNSTSTGLDRTICATVVQLNPGIITSIHAGTIAITATSNTATISSVDTSKSAVLFLGQTTTNNNQQLDQNAAKLNLTNSTTVTATRQTATGTLTVGYVVVEFSASIIQSVQETTTTILAGNTAGTSSISSVDTTNTITFYGGYACLTVPSNTLHDIPYAYLFNSTTTAAVRSSVSPSMATIDIVLTVIQLKPNIIKIVGGNRSDISGLSSSATPGAFSINTNKSISIYLGNDFGGSSSTASDLSYGSLRINNRTSVILNRNSAGGDTADTLTISWREVEFY